MALAPVVSPTGHLKRESVSGPGTPLHTTRETPDPESVTSPLSDVEELKSVPDPALKATEGAVVSMLTVAVASAEFPALSMAVPRTTWPLPSVVIVWSAGHVTMPDTESEHTKWTVTGPLFHPFAFGAGLTVAVIVGDPVSMLNAGLVNVAGFPAFSLTVPIACLSAPGGGHGLRGGH